MTALVVILLVEGHGQTAFDVASIKRNTSGEAGAGLDISRGQLRATNAPLLPVIRQAFEVMDTQVVGAPDWVATERYDILAKAPEGMTTADAMRPLLRALLAERFKLTWHRETREMPVFALVRARSDGRFGPGLRELTVDCASASQPGATSPPVSSPEDWPTSVVRFTPGRLYLGGYHMAEVLRMLTPLVGRTILDESGITFRVCVRLEYRPQGRAADAVPERIALVGTGGISHWPATPDSGKVNEAWDREFLDRWTRNDRAALLDYSDAQTYRDAGQGGFEIRTLITVAAAARGRGELRHYAPIPIFSVGCTVATMSIQ